MNSASLYLKLGGLVILVCLCSGLLYGSYQHGVTVTDLRWKALWADQQVLQANALAAATTASRAKEQRRQAAINQVRNDAREQAGNALTDAAGADVAGERVRAEAGNLAARPTCGAGDPGAAERGKTATRAAMVLSDLFQRADKRAGELARAYDAGRIAGQTCERSYDAITKHLMRE
ncbi:MAG: DUF2514 domain-containing protein [Oxalobacteraceae bacterium]|jgi:hypothetical protein|nr:MAG: DUF2514 domain-containing protein [Oxalobacteraceae bacterium]